MPAQPGDSDPDTPGASARHEYDRRRDARERRAREKHPRLGGLLLALNGEPRHQSSWARGSEGEEQVARSLAKRLDPVVHLLHDRRIPGSRANIDHIAIAPSGVWVIDAKRYKGKVAIRTPLFGQERITIDGSDRTKLIDGLDRQVGLVRDQVDEAVPVHGALCFVDADLPLLRTQKFRGYFLAYPRALAKRINAAGPLSAGYVDTIAGALAARFPRA